MIPTLTSNAVIGRARDVSEASEAEAYLLARLHGLMIDARQHMSAAERSSDKDTFADWRRNVDWLREILADHHEKIVAVRVFGETLAEIPSVETGQSVGDELRNEARRLAERKHAADCVEDTAAEAEAAASEQALAGRFKAMERRIRRLERDDRAERLASQALAVVEGRSR